MKTIRTHEDDSAGVPRAEAIVRLNDQLRVQGRGGVIMVTSGVQAVDGFNVQLLRHLLASYNRFDADNDPHGERDFGDLALNGAELLWKIDYYEMETAYGSADPADPAITRRVLTVMLASEY